jgi:nitroreductase
MTRGSDVRTPEHPVDRLFLDRWSPRAMSGEVIAESELLVLLEAARWAPSSGNAQPWRMLYARRDSEHWALFFDLLGEANRKWCVNAAVLVLFVSKTISDSGRQLVTHSYDAGAAWENLALQGTLKGLVVHGMQGFDYERARQTLQVPDEFRVEAMAAIGRPGRKEELPEALQVRETPSPRKPLAEVAWEGPFRS